MTIVAEGVETERELETLVSIGVRHGQGYLLAPPAPLPLVVPEAPPRPS